MASRSLSDLHPKAREKALQWLDACKAAGIDVLIYCTYRDAKEQDDLYRIGREIPGKRVTNAKGGQSMHQYRVAWDAVPLIGGKPAWSNSELYRRMGEIAEGFGIEWAGRWKSFREVAHFQYVEGLTLADFIAGRTL